MQSERESEREGARESERTYVAAYALPSCRQSPLYSLYSLLDTRYSIQDTRLPINEAASRRLLHFLQRFLQRLLSGHLQRVSFPFANSCVENSCTQLGFSSALPLRTLTPHPAAKLLTPPVLLQALSLAHALSPSLSLFLFLSVVASLSFQLVSRTTAHAQFLSTFSHSHTHTHLRTHTHASPLTHTDGWTLSHCAKTLKKKIGNLQSKAAQNWKFFCPHTHAQQYECVCVCLCFCNVRYFRIFSFAFVFHFVSFVFLSFAFVTHSKKNNQNGTTILMPTQEQQQKKNSK